MKSRNCLLFRSTWVHSRFLVGSCCLIFSVLCIVLLIIVCTFVPFWPLYCLFFFDLRIMIIPLVSSSFPYRRLVLYFVYYMNLLLHLFNIHAITFILLWINVREYRRGNQKKAFQRNWQHRVHKTKKNKTKAQCNVLDTTMRKQTQIT
jgi:predicted membrane protein